MAIIGSIIKGLIDLRDKIVSEPNADEAQLEVLTGLLNKAKDTAFGKNYFRSFQFSTGCLNFTSVFHDSGTKFL